MDSSAAHETTEESMNDDDTDYGSDFSPEEERILAQLLSGQQQADIEDNPIATEAVNGDGQALRLPRVLGRESRSPLLQAVVAAEELAEQISNSVKNGYYPDLSNEINRDTQISLEPPPANPSAPDTRSPLERFRTPPKKALSVTDLVSPAWCELQYWYTLTRHGRKRRTPAMKQGSVVHKELEEQVHRTVRVDIETKEDAWGLRIWNVIQGLRTLRETGQTRELEIWGVIDGLVVNGIIDELSYVCPDEELENSLQKPPQVSPPLNQPTISEFFNVAGGGSLAKAIKSKHQDQSYKVYICDVKTRSARSLPTKAAFRPTEMQLMLYHSLLSSLAINSVDFSVLAARYDLDPSRNFSDSFIAQVGSLDDELFYDGKSTSDESREHMATILAHNCLSALWSLMISEFQITLPDGTASLGNILKAEYRSSSSGEIIGSRTFAMDEAALKSYVDREMQWWRGEREAQGVVVEEAFKCRSCEFAEDCVWRLSKVEEAREKARLARKRTSTV